MRCVTEQCWCVPPCQVKCTPRQELWKSQGQIVPSPSRNCRGYDKGVQYTCILHTHTSLSPSVPPSHPVPISPVLIMRILRVLWLFCTTAPNGTWLLSSVTSSPWHDPVTMNKGQEIPKHSSVTWAGGGGGGREGRGSRHTTQRRQL